MDFIKKYYIAIAIAILAVGFSYTAGFTSGRKSIGFQTAAVANILNADAGKPEGVDFAPFWKAWNVLNEKFVSSATSTSDQEKVWGAIEGLSASLKDPYTVFFPPENNKMFQSEISGNFEGVGMEVGIKDDIITIIAPLKGTPAAKAGILSGDRILKINDVVTAGMKVDEAVKMIRGKKGTSVIFTVARDGKKEPLEIKVIRDTIEIPTIDTELRVSDATGKKVSDGAGLQENGIYVIKLYSFTAMSPDLFRQALRGFIESGSDKLILDLRGNPGGYLEAAVDIASWFLPSGKVIVTEDFGKNGAPVVYRSKGYNIFTDKLKFAILVNGGSASASEILAGALREHGKAKLVGTTTFGKGSVQELVNITPDTSLKVTVARWLTPDGTSISEKGIKPDLEVKITPEDLTKGRDPQMEAASKLLLK